MKTIVLVEIRNGFVFNQKFRSWPLFDVKMMKMDVFGFSLYYVCVFVFYRQ